MEMSHSKQFPSEATHRPIGAFKTLKHLMK